MSHSIVVGLDSGRRLGADNTIRSTCYADQASQLDFKKASLLQTMELRLFAARQGLSDCACQSMAKPMGVYKCREGAIIWFFSTRLTRFVLLDFIFSSGGSGGMPFRSGCNYPVFCGSFNYRDQIAAKHRVAAAVLTRALGVSLSREYSSIISGTYKCKNDFAGLNDRDGLLDVAICELVKQKPALDLPRWSLLLRFVKAPEQLQNTFARSILAGELICRIAVRVLFDGSVRKQKFAFHETRFHDDCRGALENIFCYPYNEDLRACRFLFTKAAGVNLLADDSYLSIARSELAGHLSLHVFHSVNSLMRKQRMLGGDDRVDYMRVMKKYALLADFISVSEGLFVGGRPRQDSASHLESWAQGINKKYLRAVELFDVSIQMVWPEVNDLDQTTQSLPNMRQKLLDLTHEILRPLEDDWRESGAESRFEGSLSES